jgi:hypothetical protein
MTSLAVIFSHFILILSSLAFSTFFGAVKISILAGSARSLYQTTRALVARFTPLKGIKLACVHFL